MVPRCNTGNRAAQRGAALLIFVFIVSIAALSAFLTQLNSTTLSTQRDKITSDALAQAKESLIGRAAADTNRPGSLPCPDTNDDGTADGPSGGICPKYIGRLPWKTLGLTELLDGNGDRLWYALSSGLRDDSTAQPINSNSPTPLELSLDGTSDIAAIIFSPGPPLPTQSGRPSNVVADYLDGDNTDGDTAYVSGPPSSSLNDKALAITRNSLFSVVNRRILSDLKGDDATGLGKYYIANGSNYPVNGADLQTELTPHLVTATNTLMTDNAWYPLIAYYANPTRQLVTLTITTPTIVICTITPPSEISCPH